MPAGPDERNSSHGRRYLRKLNSPVQRSEAAARGEPQNCSRGTPAAAGQASEGGRSCRRSQLLVAAAGPQLGARRGQPLVQLGVGLQQLLPAGTVGGAAGWRAGDRSVERGWAPLRAPRRLAARGWTPPAPSAGRWARWRAAGCRPSALTPSPRPPADPPPATPPSGPAPGGCAPPGPPPPQRRVGGVEVCAHGREVPRPRLERRQLAVELDARRR
jgi:hypothetical protein